MLFETNIDFEPVSLKRHRHRLKGGTYDPSKKDKDEFVKVLGGFPEEKMTKPINCVLDFYCKRPKNHYRSGKYANLLKDNAPKYNTNNKDLDKFLENLTIIEKDLVSIFEKNRIKKIKKKNHKFDPNLNQAQDTAV